MKKVKVISPSQKQDQKIAKVKGGRIMKKDKTKKTIGGPGSTPFHSVESKLKDVLASEAKDFSLSKKKIEKLKSPERKPPVGTPTTDGKKKNAKKAIMVEDGTVSPKIVAQVTPVSAKAKKQSPVPGKNKKKLKGLKSETNIPEKGNDVKNVKQDTTTKCPILIPSNVSNAIKALRKNMKQFKTKNTKIVDETTPLMLSVNFFKLPKPNQIHSRALLPHSIVTDLNDVCFFVRDPKKKKNEADDDESWEDEVREALKKHGVNNISEIWPWRKFMKLNTQFEEKKKFADRFDYILADSVISYRWMGVLNKSIFKNKYPIPVRYSPTSPKLKKEFDNALRKVQVKVEGKGLTSACVFGHDGLADSQLADNLNALCLFLSDKGRYPGGAANIRALHIKTARSEAFPIYISLASANQVEVPKNATKRKSQAAVGELSTLYHDGQVKVYPDGRIYQVKRLKALQEVENNSSPIKKVDPKGKQMNSDDSDDDDLDENYIEQNNENDDDVNQDSSEEEDQVEEVEREYLQELREMQDKPKKLPKKKASKTTDEPLKNKSGKTVAEKPLKKKSSPSVNGKTAKSTRPSVKGKAPVKESPVAKKKKTKSTLKGSKK